MKCLVMTKILFYAPRGLAALLKDDRENKSLKENQRVKMFFSGGVSRSCLRCFYFLPELYTFKALCPFEKIKMQSCQHDIGKSILALGFKLLEN